MKREKTPLRCRIVKGVLTIEIGVDTLKFAAERHEAFWQPQTDKFALVVANAARFAKDVRNELEQEAEDGSTPIHRLLDQAVEEAANNGSEGLDYDAMDALITEAENADRRAALTVDAAQEDKHG